MSEDNHDESEDSEGSDEPPLPENNEYENVVDESGTVSNEHKQAIIKARNRIDEREDAMFTGPLIDPAIGDGISDRQRVKAMGRTIRMLIRRLRPLLVRDTVEGAEEYAQKVQLGSVSLLPPDKDGIPFSDLAHGDIDEKAFRQAYNLPREAELPEPKQVTFTGLLSILQAPDEITQTWRVKTDTQRGQRLDDVLTLRVSRPIPMHILENAVMACDDFMQEAGIGVKLDTGDPVGYT